MCTGTVSVRGTGATCAQKLPLYQLHLLGRNRPPPPPTHTHARTKAQTFNIRHSPRCSCVAPRRAPGSHSPRSASFLRFGAWKVGVWRVCPPPPPPPIFASAPKCSHTGNLLVALGGLLVEIYMIIRRSAKNIKEMPCPAFALRQGKVYGEVRRGTSE